MQEAFFGALLFLSLISCSADNYKTTSEQTTDQENAPNAINNTIDVSPALAEFSPESQYPERDSLREYILEFYSDRNNCTFWLGSEKPMPRVYTLINTLEDFSEDGNMAYSEFEEKLNGLLSQAYRDEESDTAYLAQTDLKLTEYYTVLADNLLDGQLTTYSSGEALYYIEQGQRNVLQDLASIETDQEMDSLLNAYRPQLVEYKTLLEKFREIKSGEDSLAFQFSCDHLSWDSLAKDSMTKHLTIRLKQWGISVADTKPSETQVANAIGSFQKLRGMTNTGKLDCETAKRLNMPKSLVLEKIALNLERMKGLPRRIGKEYIMVNIPEYKVRVFNQGRSVFESRVIVGKEYNPTPVFADTLSYLVFSPTWTVPQSIIHEEMIPKLREDPGYYESRNFKAYKDGEEIDQKKFDWNSKVVESAYFRFVQQPGPSNALGRVKFIMPNDMSIYLHDTPSDYLFDQAERSLSHGCVRVEKPQAFAEYLLQDQENWNSEKIVEALNRDEPLQVHLTDKLPVEVVYLTTWVNEEGQLAIFPDIYGHDAEQKEQLAESYNMTD